MKMRHWVSLIGAALMLAVTGSIAKAQEDPEPDPGEGGACFKCADDWLDQGSTQVWWHWDWYMIGGPKYQNNFHGSGQASGGCWVHANYNLPEEEPSPAALELATDEELVRLMLENENIEINLERSAVQVLRGDQVVVHLPVSLGRARRLQAQLTAMGTETAVAVAIGRPALQDIVALVRTEVDRFPKPDDPSETSRFLSEVWARRS